MTTTMRAKHPSLLTKTDKRGTATVLRRMIRLYSKPGTWARGEIADKVDRRRVDIMPAAGATRFCLIGAARKVDTAYEAQALRVLAHVIDQNAALFSDNWNAEHPYPRTVYQWNDSVAKTQDQVVRMLKRALKRVTV